MEREKQEAIIEAVLFTMGESVEISKLAELIEETKGNTKKKKLRICNSYTFKYIHTTTITLC